MSELVDPEQIEAIVGARRHETVHIGRAVPGEARVYILHSRECVERREDLRDCPYSIALDRGIDERPVSSIWARRWGLTVKLIIVDGRLSPQVLNSVTAPSIGVELISPKDDRP